MLALDEAALRQDREEPVGHLLGGALQDLGAAARLGLKRTTLQSRLRALGIHPPASAPRRGRQDPVAGSSRGRDFGR